MSEDLSEEVVLEIEGAAIKCKKQDLINHSDYFKAMFEGNFLERNKKVIKLQDINLKSMNIILLLLFDRDNTLLIDEIDDAVSVLQTSCMLQFDEIKHICIKRLTTMLLPDNCIKIWLVAEQLDLRPLYLKAKSMALTEFQNLQESDIIMKFNLNQLCKYLGNTCLQCKSELDVFQVCMKWWYENSRKLTVDISKEYLESYSTEVFMALLACLDFNNLNSSDIQEMLTYPDLSHNNDIVQILSCVVTNIKTRDQNVSYNEDTVIKAKALCNCNFRISKQLPCIFLHNIPTEPPHKRLKLSEDASSIVYCDAFGRKRYYENLEFQSTVTIVQYDENKNYFKKLLSIDKQKCEKLEGFTIVGYKEFIFLFGGEFVMGNGNWHKNFWVYSTTTDCWERKSLMPAARRHFQSCMVDSTLYIIGGTGNYRIIRGDMFSYNFKEDKWSDLIPLPCGTARELKCCSWNGKLFLFNINEKSAYIYESHKQTWTTLIIVDYNNIAKSFPAEYTVFTYKDSIYLKSDNLIELKKVDQRLLITKYIPMEKISYEEINSIVCGDTVYTLYKKNHFPDKTLTLEKYCMVSGKVDFIFKEAPEGCLIEIQDNNCCSFKMSAILFGLQHYELVATDDFVNEMYK